MRRRQRSRRDNAAPPNAAQRSLSGNTDVPDIKPLINHIDTLLNEEDVERKVAPVCPRCGGRHD